MQDVQTAWSAALVPEAEYVPDRQTLQSSSPSSGLYLPLLQTVQPELPVEGWYEPGGQTEQSLSSSWSEVDNPSSLK